jgi:hypothetical protein
MFAQFPSSVFRLLELIVAKPHVRWNEIPADLRDAWRIARTSGLLDSDASLNIYGNAEQFDAYRESCNFAYWMTEHGKTALAWHRAKQTCPPRDPSAEPAARQSETPPANSPPTPAPAGQGSTLAMTATDPARQQSTPPADSTTPPRLDPERFRHGPDYRDCMWNGTHYTVTATQAACVKVLWEAWEHGTPEVGQQHILETAGSESSSLKDVFKGSTAWKTMIVSTRQGLFRLAEPT